MKYVKISDNTARQYAKQMAECDSIQRKSGSKEIPQDLDKLENLIKKHWAALTPAIIEPYIQGMEDRFRSVLSNGGGYSNY